MSVVGSIIGGVLGSVASIGAGGVTASAIAKYFPFGANKIVQTAAFIGSVGLAGAAGDMAAEYVTDRVDAVDTLVCDVAGLITGKKSNSEVAQDLVEKYGVNVESQVTHDDGVTEVRGTDMNGRAFTMFIEPEEGETANEGTVIPNDGTPHIEVVQPTV